MTIWWILVAIGAIGIEVALTNFVFFFVALAALVAALLASIGLGPVVQASVFAVAAGFMPVFLRRPIMRRFAGRGVPSRTDTLIGATAEVTEAIDPVRGTGRVLVGGQDWAARSENAVPAGSTVTVVEADGIVLIVA